MRRMSSSLLLFSTLLEDSCCHVTGLRIGDDHIVPLLQALVWSESAHSNKNKRVRGLMSRWKDLGYGVGLLTALNSKQSGRRLLQPFHAPDQNPFNRSITKLSVTCRMGQQHPALGEVLGCVLRSNRALKKLSLDSFFVTRGLEALRENSSITKLTLVHSEHLDDDDMDPMLIEILGECKTVRKLRLLFQKPFGPCAFTEAFFQGLHSNRSIQRLVLDGWDGLDDYMFCDLLGSLGPDSNNVLEEISVERTSWDEKGIGRMLDISLEKLIKPDSISS